MYFVNIGVKDYKINFGISFKNKEENLNWKQFLIIKDKKKCNKKQTLYSEPLQKPKFNFDRNIHE
jgi:hypothetical protein